MTVKIESWGAAANVIGLMANLIGVILLFRFGMPYRVPTAGGAVRVTLPDPGNTKAESRYNFWGNLGLALIVIGTIAQIVASLIPPSPSAPAQSSAQPAATLRFKAEIMAELASSAGSAPFDTLSHQ